MAAPVHQIGAMGLLQQWLAVSDWKTMMTLKPASSTRYVWSNWTTKAVQPMHIDEALQAMIGQASRCSADTTKQPPTPAGDKGSYASTFPSAAPFPDSSRDVSMEPSADKRSRESPDSTLKPEGKSLKTSGSATPSSYSHYFERMSG